MLPLPIDALNFRRFFKHYKSSTDDDSTTYKLGDSQTWNKETWYFCDCPTYRDHIKWHIHTADTCRTRLKWLESKNTSSSTSPPTAHISDDPTDLEPAPGITPPPTDITGFLVSALSLSQDNPIAHDLIADALNAFHNL